MDYSTQQYNLHHLTKTADYLIYKNFLYDLINQNTLPSQHIPNTLQKGLLVSSNTPLDLCQLFESSILYKIAYCIKQPFSIGIEKIESTWKYLFYTPHSDEFLEQILSTIFKLFGLTDYEWIDYETFYLNKIYEITCLSSTPTLELVPKSRLTEMPHSFKLMFLLQPVPPSVIAQEISALQSLHQQLSTIKEFSNVHTQTHTVTHSDSCNHANTSSTTNNQSDAETTGYTLSNGNNCTANSSLNYKFPKDLTLNYSYNQNRTYSTSHNKTNNLSQSSSSQNSSNQGNNSSKGCTHTETTQTTSKAFFIQATQNMNDAELLLDYYHKLLVVPTYTVSLYFLADLPLESLSCACTYTKLFNPTPSLLYPEFVNYLNKQHTNFDFVTQSLLSCQHPYFYADSPSTYVTPSLYCCCTQLCSMLKMISP